MELVKTIVDKGQHSLYAFLYDRYAIKVFNKCYSFVKDTDEAKDLTQDVFLRAFLKLSTYDRDKAAFATWLYVITYNLCANYMVREKQPKQREEMRSNKVMSSLEQIDMEEINALDPDKLGLALDRIAPEDKALLLLKYQDDASIKSIQTLLGVGESAIKMRLNRAKQKVVKSYYQI
ncbi:RNA polymerase sigma factor [Robiginitalea sp. IMCC43444]|uniref:RNA polymerase sigma factor n=1 Tax=Robiginitalea sp. IMCC43444 TaxID=3459121 RepID=UPI00404172C6